METQKMADGKTSQINVKEATAVLCCGKAILIVVGGVAHARAYLRQHTSIGNDTIDNFQYERVNVVEEVLA